MDPVPERTRDAFHRVHVRWLPVWGLVGGGLAIMGIDFVEEAFAVDVPEDLLGSLLYVPLIAWVALVVVRRNGVDLAAMLRWPRLGAYWWVVAGLFVVQFLFSVAAATLTGMLFPWLGDSVEGVGQGNLALALLGLAILPPLVEEVIFRGVLVERFAVKWRLGVGIVVSALAFALLHADPVGAAMFGLITGVLYVRVGSLWPGIVIHAANNLVVLVATRVTPSDNGVEPSTREAVASVGIFLALSLPFLVWFLVRAWPARGVPTPYQAALGVPGAPRPRDAVVFPDLAWSASPLPVTLTVTPTQLVVHGAGPMGGPAFAALPVVAVARAYVGQDPGGGPVVVVLLRDGSWTTLRCLVPGVSEAAIAQAITDSLAAVGGMLGGFPDDRPPPPSM